MEDSSRSWEDKNAGTTGNTESWPGGLEGNKDSASCMSWPLWRENLAAFCPTSWDPEQGWLQEQCVHLVVGRNLKTEENLELLFPALTQVHREREQDMEQKQMKTMRLGEERNVRKFLSNTVHFRWCSNLQRSQRHFCENITKASPVFSSPQVQLFNILPSTSSEAQKNTVWIATGTTPFLILLSPIGCFSHGCD